MYIEAIITCVNYSDFLSWSLLFNRSQFNNIVVVTTPDDTKTKEVCAFYHVRCLITEAFYADEQTFGKSNAINVALASDLLTKKGWIVHMDADIVLPPRSMDFIQRELIDTNAIYGIDRISVVGFQRWCNFISEPTALYEQEVWLRLDKFPIMPRVFKQGHFVPIGFFQAWYAPNNDNTYPTVHENAARADMLQAMKWDGPQRKLISNAVAIHLESEKGFLGINWNGRQTAAFTFPLKQVPWWQQLVKRVRSIVQYIHNWIRSGYLL
jgi:hypothetical protein